MLPGFRFLFVTVVLAGAVLIFGLGAAALLRAAHEEFASLPSWRTAPPLPAQRADPTLALLRVETPAIIPDAAKDRAPVVAIDAPDATAGRAAVSPETSEAPKPDATAVPPTAVAETTAPAIVEASLSSAPAGTVTPDAASPQAAAPVPQATAPNTAAQQPSDGAASAGPETEPKPTTVASLPVPAKIEAATQPGKPTAAKARQAAAKAAARRRLAIMRARAAARARALQLQKQKTIDPLAQLFGGT
jgi:hypothetical protein